jgi:Domain of unknown function (DUF5666)
MTMKTITRLLAYLMLLVAAGCGGGGSGDPGGGNPPPGGGIVRTGFAVGPIANFGSVIVNGVRYTTTGATITVDDSPGVESDLRVGQVVRIRGELDAGLTTGTASQINFDDSVEGPVQSINVAGSSLVVLGQTVRIGAATSFDDNIQPASLAGLVVGDIVEVSGLVMADGSIDATRIEKKLAGSLFEVHGTISNLDTVNRRFNLNALVVDYSGAQLDDFPGGQISNGQPVEAKGSVVNANGTLVATRVEFEGSLVAGPAGDRVEIEGFITRFVSAQDFDVSGVPVTTGTATVFEGGTAADLGLNVKVEVEGNLTASGSITATKVDIRRATAVRVTALVDSVNAAANSLDLLGITVRIDALTRLEDKSAADVDPLTISSINVGDYLEVRGAELPAGSGDILATIVERDDVDTETILQGFVTSVANPSFTILGVTITTNGATQFRDVDDSPISAATFFGRVAAGSLVKAKGLETSTTTMTAEEVEFE